jgi:hypothetical protein
MKTQKDITYNSLNAGVFVIPAGTTVKKAHNLPARSDSKSLYWCNGWRGMGAMARSFCRNYGFLLTLNEVKGVNQDSFCVSL